MISNSSQLSTLKNGVYSDGYNILFRWYCNGERESKEKDKYLAIYLNGHGSLTFKWAIRILLFNSP